MSSGELLLDSFASGDFAVHPWVSNNVGHAKALMWVQLEHARDEVFEFRGEESCGFSLLMCLPEEIGAVCGKELVVLVFGFSHLERRVLGVHDEKNHTSCEEINHLPLIRLLLKDLRSHVSWSSND